MSISFRPITESDLPFLSKLYASTREQEMAVLPWTTAQKVTFVKMQFNAQHKFFKQEFNNAEFNIVLKNDVAIGRMYVERRENEIRIIDVTLMPDYRGQGIGQILMKSLLDESAGSEKPVTVNIEKDNPAMSFYERFGFEYVEDQGVYQLIRWSAANET